jgi:hypothetical protein
MRRSGTAGLVLITIGVLALAAILIGSPLAGEFFLAGLGLVLIVWGLAARHVGPIVPGGVLLGIGAGILLAQQLYNTTQGSHASAIILVSMGGGFILITPLSRTISSRWQLWPLLPGLILALIGGAIFSGGIALEVVNFAGLIWPVLLIALGAYLVLQAGRSRHRSGT